MADRTLKTAARDGVDSVSGAHDQGQGEDAAEQILIVVHAFIVPRTCSGVKDATSRRIWAFNAEREGNFFSARMAEMNDSVNRLSLINVDSRWAEFRDMLKQFHQERIALVQEMNQMSKMLLAGPEPGVNYGKFTARAPELTAQVEDIDKSIFTMAQAMFLALVDEARVGADGNLHHLILTKKDRASMVQLIDKIFGPTLEDKNASRIVSSAWVIKYGLTRPHYKAADEL